MYVVATAGHVDHGKSTLIRALTGQEPDRLAEERRRGLSIELGYAWTRLADLGEVAFVDVPGHERFVPTMLAGVGPVAVAMLVVAADDPWMPQAAEHLAALDALHVRHGLLVVTRCDLADPSDALAGAQRALTGTGLADIPHVAVAAPTGVGLDRLRTRLAEVLGSVPTPDPAHDVRFWVDRAFTVRGAGRVVTGTLQAGTIRVGDRLDAGDRPVVVRGLQALGRDVSEARGCSRLAIRLGGGGGDVGRGATLTTPGAWRETTRADLRVDGGDGTRRPQHLTVHIGSVSLPARLRDLGRRPTNLVRMILPRPLPLRVGDRVLLREPGSHRIWGAAVLDPQPPPLARRGAAHRRAEALAPSPGLPDLADELRRRRWASSDQLRTLGVPAEEVSAATAGTRWAVHPGVAEQLAQTVTEAIRAHDRQHPLDPGLREAEAVRLLGLPDPALLSRLVQPPVHRLDGRLMVEETKPLPTEVAAAVETLRSRLTADPFAAPDVAGLRELGLDTRALAAAARVGLLLRLDEQLVLLPGADALALDRLAALAQPFTVSEARRALGTTRRVALPLLAHLDRSGATKRLPDDRRILSAPGPGSH